MNSFCFFSCPLKHFAVYSVQLVCFLCVTHDLGFTSHFFLWCGNGVFEFASLKQEIAIFQLTYKLKTEIQWRCYNIFCYSFFLSTEFHSFNYLKSRVMQTAHIVKNQNHEKYSKINNQRRQQCIDIQGKEDKFK